jgi:hypothetical protein
VTASSVLKCTAARLAAVWFPADAAGKAGSCDAVDEAAPPFPAAAAVGASRAV